MNAVILRFDLNIKGLLVIYSDLKKDDAQELKKTVVLKFF